MKKLLIAVMMISLVWGCKKEKEADYTTLIRGVWLNTHVNDQPVQTDNAFVMEFKADFSEIYASGAVINDSNRTWLESDQFIYSVDGNKLLINGESSLGNIFSMEFEILHADETSLRYSVKKFVVDDVSIPDSKIYTCQRVIKNLKQQFIGTWYGRSTTPGSDSSYHYWDYFADGTYDYYFQDTANNWVRKQDNDGQYYLYGDFMVSLYNNDLLSGVTGKAYECWNIRIEDNMMYWNGLRDGGVTTSFEMERVTAPPSGK